MAIGAGKRCCCYEFIVAGQDKAIAKLIYYVVDFSGDKGVDDYLLWADKLLIK